MKNPEANNGNAEPIADPIEDWMKQLGNDPTLQARSMPDPDLLWMKSQYLERMAAQERALKPVDLFATVARVLVGFAVCWVALNLTKYLGIHVAAKIDSAWLSLGVAVILSGIVMATYPLWADE